VAGNSVGVERLTSADSAVLDLAASFRQGPLSGYRHYGFDVAGADTARRLVAALDDPESTVLVATQAGEVTGALWFTPSPWESSTLGVRVARVSEVVTRTGPHAASSAAALFDQARGRWAAGGGHLLIGRVDVGDAPGLIGAQDAGMRVLETRVTYVYDNDQPFRFHGERRGYDVRRHVGDEITTIPSETLSILRRWVADTDRPGHFYSDLKLPAGAADRLYLSWLERTFEGRWGDVVYTAWRDDEVVGFLAWLEAAELRQSHGIGTLLPGLGAAAAPEGRGSLVDMYATVCGDRPLGARFVEHTTQAGNAAVLTTWARFPALRLASAQYVLHGWCDA
jgi:hypothetical protein